MSVESAATEPSHSSFKSVDLKASASPKYDDDPARDFRQRWRLPEHFVWDDYDFAKMDLEGYVRVAIDLLPKPPQSVLDVGCGDGWVASELDRAGYQVTGIDFSDRAVGFASIVVPRGSFHVLDVRQLGEKKEWAEQFDCAVHIEVLEHIPPAYHSEIIASIRRCLKPGGTFVLTLPSIHIPVNPWHYKHFERAEGEALLTSQGFRIKKIVNQCRVSPLWSPTASRLLRNRYYDLRVARRALRELFLKKMNVVSDPKKAGRYIYLAEK